MNSLVCLVFPEKGERESGANARWGKSFEPFEALEGHD